MITFKINRSDCFDEKTNAITIRLGNSAEIDAVLVDENDSEIILGNDDYILLYVEKRNKEFVYKKVFSGKDYNEEGYLSIKLKPSDTLVKFKPNENTYQYGLSLILADGGDEEDVYTYVQGKFIVLPSIGTLKDITD